ncbi:AraC family transcriptional regulator [Paenibacillus thiaminolyticus]|uniref:AraC family transcriptional regulator n=1 Tax=Paenibacillus thiaminolyticus TaxID=49283 RepID=A0A3A3GM27_PANTH|nr:helix-turn-helix domain-containing protein [Paenibacillus thiaminolyticus]RJG25927.1 AraC family transcriptional regulator [Paenibacillus thiaminolyticus]
MNWMDFLFYSKRKTNYYIPLHEHDCYELVYYFGGSGKSRIGSKMFSFSDDRFAVISPGTIHDERHDVEGDVLFIGFHSDSDGLRNINAVLEDNEGLIRQLILRMNEEFAAKRPSYSEMLNFMTGELVIQIERMTALKKSAESSLNQLQYVRNYLDEHYRQKISIESLAKMSGYSYDRFRHLFKETYGIAPLQYIFKKRLDYAKLMLYETNEQISKIALMSGFSSEAQFCSMFKRETGKTAKAFRQRSKH